MNSLAIKFGQKDLKRSTGAVHKWVVDNIERDVTSMNSHLEKLADLSIFNSPNIPKLDFKFRAFYRIFSLLPGIKNLMRILKYRF